MKKVCIVGHFGFGENLLNGQTVKTKNITYELEKLCGKDNVIKIDTHGGMKKLFNIILKIFKAFKYSENIIILPAHNGIRIFVPLCDVINIFFKRKLHYIVIGGWLPSFLKKRGILKFGLRYFNSIYVETSTTKRALVKLGLDNVEILKNFKNLTIISNSELKSSYSKPYKICTFSRVMREKGIEDIVDAVISINKKNRDEIYRLDIYGQVETEQEDWFENLKKSFPEYISYKGTVSFDKSVEVLKEYFLLAFPTRFFTEGIPGTILDAYAAGVPVISSRWESFFDVVDDGYTGIGYEFGNKVELENLLEQISHTPEIIVDKKYYCLRKAKEYVPKVVLHALLENCKIY